MTELHPLRRVRNAEYATLPTAPAAARREVVQTLKDWGEPDLIDIAELLVSELVTNSIRATGTTVPARRYTDLHDVNRVVLRLRLESTELVISVWDGDPDPPSPKPCDVEAETGRGLQLVQGMSARWGWYPAYPGGKVTWATVTR